MNGYTKLFGSILDSSVWQEPDHVRLVWVTMLAMADRNGHVEAAVPGLAARARVPIENCIDALKRLMDKDEYSRTPDNDGRRIVTIDGGWLIINHAKYRAKMSEDSSATNTTMGYVYYAGTKTGDKIRIGWSKNPWARIKERQKSNPDIVLIGTEQGTMDLKIARLISFKAIDSEWVTANADLINHINSLRSDERYKPGDL
jgi:hypothetical protein